MQALVFSPPFERAAGGGYADAFTLSIPASGQTGDAETVTVTPNGVVGPGSATVTLAADSGTLGSLTLTWTAGESTAKTTTLTRATNGTSTVTMTNDAGMSNAGTPATYASTGAAVAAFTIKTDGMWTWFNDPRAVTYNGNTYIGWVNSAGDIGITKVNNTTHSASSFTLAAGFELDDHDNPAIVIRPDGRIAVAYCRHPDGSNQQHYRVSTNAEDISAWGADTALSATEPAYANLHYLSTPGRYYLHYRSGTTGNRKTNVRSTADWSSWAAEATWITGESNNRPYVKSCNNGTDTIHFLVTTGHPDTAQNSLYHCKVVIDSGGTESWKKSDGTALSSQVPSSMTPIYVPAGSDNCWNWDIQLDINGYPWVLFAKVVSPTDHRLMFARWDGSAWTTPVQVVAMGPHIYPSGDTSQAYYSGGGCFDTGDITKVYAAVYTSGQFEIQRYATTDNGATWSKSRDITTGSGSVRNARPFSPKNRDASLPCLWWAGTYTSYLSYSTDIIGGG